MFITTPTCLCALMATMLTLLAAASRVSGLASVRRASPQEKRAYYNADTSDHFWFDCNYHSIESNYFQRTNTSTGMSDSAKIANSTWNTFVLAPGSQLTYRCILIIDTRNCGNTSNSNNNNNSNRHRQQQLPPPVNCQDVQVDIQPPRQLITQDEDIREGFSPVPYYPGFDKYLIWLNVTNFSAPHHAGEYYFVVQLAPSRLILFEHRLGLLPLEEPQQQPEQQQRIPGLFTTRPLATVLVVLVAAMVIILASIASFTFFYFLRNTSGGGDSSSNISPVPLESVPRPGGGQTSAPNA